MTEFEFKSGDKVKCAFYGDKIFTLEAFQFSDGLIIKYGDDCVTFLADGRYMRSHTQPVLTLVERPNTKVKITRWINVYQYGSEWATYSTASQARKYANETVIASVELTGEYET